METVGELSQRQKEPGCMTALCSFHGLSSSDSGSNRDTVRQHDSVWLAVSHSPCTTECLFPSITSLIKLLSIQVSQKLLDNYRTSQVLWGWQYHKRPLVKSSFILMAILGWQQLERDYSFSSEQLHLSTFVTVTFTRTKGLLTCSNLENIVISNLTQQLFHTPRCKL